MPDRILPWSDPVPPIQPERDDVATAAEFNLWCAVNGRPFHLVNHVWADGQREWGLELKPGRPDGTIAYGTGQSEERLAVIAAFAFLAGIEWGEANLREAALADLEDDDDRLAKPAIPPSPRATVPQPSAPADGEVPLPIYLQAPILPERELDEDGSILEDDDEAVVVAGEEDADSDGLEGALSEPDEPTPEDQGSDGPEDLGSDAEEEPARLPGLPLSLTRQRTLPSGERRYDLPSSELLAAGPVVGTTDLLADESLLAQNARLLETVLRNFGVRGEIMEVRPGPVVTLYELEPAPGTKSSRVINLADDIARSMSAIAVRIAIVPGRSVIGIELPNPSRETVYLREMLTSPAYMDHPGKLPLILGKDIGGDPVVVDLAKMPHLLIAGTTGSGKSVGINTMIMSLVFRLPPSQCRFIMVDPKMLELSVYDGIPHLLTPVVTDPKKAVVALKWAVREMESRYRAMSKLGVRNIEGFNARAAEMAADPAIGEDDRVAALPYIVIIVDEMADLMLVAGKDIEAAIQRLAQMARAAGIHLIMATQRPSVDVITGTIKANFPTRISFQVTSKIDSRTILGEAGAEQLLGQGDMLYMAGGGRITRVHGPFVSDQEVERIVGFVKSQGEPDYIDDIVEDEDDFDGGSAGEGGFVSEGGSGDELYDQAVALVMRERKCTVSFIQRHLQIGYNRAARIVERMEEDGVISSANHVGKREVLGRSVRGGRDD
ncbi:MAG: DNA translocase FtsK [Alphaproteobacteria bacterium]|nr:MAG: DNA translocase FtsK [Alphaproteobacteria bacterium]